VRYRGLISRRARHIAWVRESSYIGKSLVWLGSSMPFKSLQAFNIEEDCVRLWAEDLNPNTAKNYVYCSLRHEGHRSTGKPRKRYEACREVVHRIHDPCYVRPDEALSPRLPRRPR